MAVENDVRIWAQGGKIYMTGNITDERHRDLFIAKLRLDKPEPTLDEINAEIARVRKERRERKALSAVGGVS